MKKKPADRRRAILKAALDEVARHGYFETRMDDIARRAHVAKGTVYLYFRDKTDLYLGLIDWLLVQALETVTETDARPLSPRAKLNRIFKVWSENVFSRPGVHALLSLEHTNLPSNAVSRFRHTLAPRVTQIVEAVSRIIRPGIKSGQFRRTDPDVAALCFLQAFRTGMIAFRQGLIAGRNQYPALDLFFSGILSTARRNSR